MKISLIVIVALLFCSCHPGSAADAAQGGELMKAKRAYEVGELEVARAALLAILSTGDSRPEVYYYLGLVSYRQQDSQQARRYWRSGLDKYPGDYFLRRVMGESLLGAESSRLAGEARLGLLRARGSQVGRPDEIREMLWFVKGSPVGVTPPLEPLSVDPSARELQRFSSEERRGLFLRSLLLPGWGQYTIGQRASGVQFVVEYSMLAGLSGVLALYQRNVRRRYEYADDPYSADKLYHRGEELYRATSVLTGMAVGVLVWNLVDIIRATAPGRDGPKGKVNNKRSER
jgi:tetratricopeptide (TPR) repeat protein